MVLEVGPGVTASRPATGCWACSGARSAPVVVADDRLAHPDAGGLVLRGGGRDAVGVPDRLVRPGRTWPGCAPADGAGPRRDRRGRHGGRPARPAPRRRGVRHGQPGQVGRAGALGLADARIASSRDAGRSRPASRATGGAAWTWCSTRWPASSWTPRCGCCRAAAGSSRWARPTCATPEQVAAGSTPACRTRPFDLMREPARRVIGAMLAEVRRRCSAQGTLPRCRSVTGTCARRPGGVPLPEPGPAHRQGGADHPRRRPTPTAPC